MFLGIAAGLVSALLQSTSYVCSANFMLKYKSPLRLVIFSQLVMGAFCLPFVPFLFPRELLNRLPEFALWVGAWLLCFSIGQTDNGIVQVYAARPKLQYRWFCR